ncbi:MAG: ribosome maturation factor RimP [Eubacteriales bacterium]|nr:ribosome maturation factor RimP [Eubacteriales bacterium]
MTKKNGSTNKTSAVHVVEERALRVAQELSLELVEVTLQKESRGKCLCIYVDSDNGISLDDCERYHRALMPLLDDVDYDVMEVSSPGVDRPIKTLRDFEKHRDALVEVKLFAPKDGCKLFQGTLCAMDDQTVSIRRSDNEELTFECKAVAVIKPIIEFEDEDLPEDDAVSESDFYEMELE